MTNSEPAQPDSEASLPERLSQDETDSSNAVTGSEGDTGFLSLSEVTAASGKSAGILSNKDNDPVSLKQENTRTALAIMLLLVFAMSIGASFVYIFVSRFLPKKPQCSPTIAVPLTESSPSGFVPGVSVPDASPPPASPSSPTPQTPPAATGTSFFCSFDNSPEQLVTLILNSLTAIIGTALGFYFGAQAKEDFRSSEQPKIAPTGQNTQTPKS